MADKFIKLVNGILVEAEADHGSMAGLGDDDHAQYLLLAGRIGGQQITGNIGVGEAPNTQAGIARFISVGGSITVGFDFHPSGSAIEGGLFAHATGMFFDVAGSADKANNTIAFRTGVANSNYTVMERMRIDGATGYVGVNNDHPNQVLDVVGGVAITGPASLPVSIGTILFSFEHPVSRIYFGDGSGYNLAFAKRASSTTTDLVTISDGGNMNLVGVLKIGAIQVVGAQQAHIVDASTSNVVTDPADTPATADALRDDLVANTLPSIRTGLNNLGAKINSIFTAMETHGLLASS
jgi:hypothetical protein